jgi:hypothetical protein
VRVRAAREPASCALTKRLGTQFLTTFQSNFHKKTCFICSSDVMFSDHNLNQSPEQQIDIEDEGLTFRA